MNEADLAMPVMEWLSSRGFKPYGEVPFYNRAIDVVGVGEESLEAVELKLSLTKHVLYQAHINQLAASRSWCAVSTRPRNFAVRMHSGIGLLMVKDGRVDVLKEAEEKVPLNARWDGQIRGACHYKEPFGAAGTPTMRGIGPAQDVFRALEKYRQEHPDANWKDIFRDVPNHYKHHRSMQGAMSVVFMIRKRRSERDGGGAV